MRTLAIAALSVVAVMVATLLVVREVQNRYVVVRSYTDDAGGLAEGTSVRLNGISIGYLDRVALTNLRDPQRKIELFMKVHRSALSEIPRDSLVSVAATNLLGNYYLDIIRGQSPQAVAEGGELRPTSSTDPNRLLAEMGNELQEIQGIFGRFDKLVTSVQQGQGNIGMWQKEGSNRVNDLSAEWKKTMESARGSRGNLDRVDELKAQMDATQKRLDDLEAAYQGGQGTAGKLGALSKEMQQATDEGKALLADARSEHGPTAQLTKLQGSFSRLEDSLQTASDRLTSTTGTLGQFEVNPRFSEALAGATTDFEELAKGIRKNPRKFLSFHFQLF